MTVITRARAEMLRTGMTFDLFGNNCMVIYAEPNDFGQIVIRFVTSGFVNAVDKTPNTSVLIVKPDLLFPITHL